MKIHIKSDGTNVYVLCDGERIAKRESSTWVSLKQGFEVRDVRGKDGEREIEVFVNGQAALH